MTNVQSKLTSVLCTCQDFHHPWTDSCMNASAGIMISATLYCLRIYTIVYAFSLIMRHRIPKLNDLKKTLMGILQSSAFLTTNGCAFVMYNCILRNIIGRYHWHTVAFIPSFLASWTALAIERPPRRPLLTLYVANVASETLWNMAESRGLVRSIPHGHTLIFGVSLSVLLYLYRLGLHKTTCKDSLFNILRIFVGKTEEGHPQGKSTPNVHQRPIRSRPPLDFSTTSGLLQAYKRFIDSLKGKHPSCSHKQACISYALIGGLKPFVGGVSLQVALKVLMNIKKIIQFRMQWRKTILNGSTLKLGLFLGCFSFLYKSVSCVLRHGFGYDDPRFAIPAGLIGSIAFTQYPDTTVALYVMWKMFQIIYDLGVQKGKLPNVPGFMFILYSFCTAVLFHAAILEPNNLRPSYYKFLQSISGERVSKFNLLPFELFGLNSHNERAELIKRLKIRNDSALPKFPFTS